MATNKVRVSWELEFEGLPSAAATVDEMIASMVLQAERDWQVRITRNKSRTIAPCVVSAGRLPRLEL